MLLRHMIETDECIADSDTWNTYVFVLAGLQKQAQDYEGAIQTYRKLLPPIGSRRTENETPIHCNIGSVCAYMPAAALISVGSACLHMWQEIFCI
jgi:hypothetical protein